MNCPNCKQQLAITERMGIEIDYCPSCRGIWLDRGELDKLLDRSGTYHPEKKMELNSDYGYRSQEEKYRGSRKRKNFIEELFDF